MEAIPSGALFAGVFLCGVQAHAVTAPAPAIRRAGALAAAGPNALGALAEQLPEGRMVGDLDPR